MRGIWALAVLTAGCFDPQLPAQIECPTGLCPGNLVCTGGFCVQESGADASRADRSMIGDADPLSDAPDGCTVYSFQQGVDGYSAALDTEIAELQPDDLRGADDRIGWDGQDVNGGPQLALIRFRSVIGPDSSQVPLGATIELAELVVTIFDDGGLPLGTVHESLVAITDATTWNSFGATPGIINDLSAPIASAPIEAGVQRVEVTQTVQDYSDGAAQNGWAFQTTASNGVQIRSSEEATIADRPRLDVVVCPGGV